MRKPALLSSLLYVKEFAMLSYVQRRLAVIFTDNEKLLLNFATSIVWITLIIEHEQINPKQVL